jgi:hypothetical protein
MQSVLNENLLKNKQNLRLMMFNKKISEFSKWQKIFWHKTQKDKNFYNLLLKKSIL